MLSCDDVDNLICPITLELFRDPVRAEDGRLYERAAITRWIKESGTSPFTRQVLKVNRLKSDVQIREKADQQQKLSVEHERQPQGVRLPPIRPSRNNTGNSTSGRVQQSPRQSYKRGSHNILDSINKCCDSICEATEIWCCYVLDTTL